MLLRDTRKRVPLTRVLTALQRYSDVPAGCHGALADIVRRHGEDRVCGAIHDLGTNGLEISIPAIERAAARIGRSAQRAGVRD